MKWWFYHIGLYSYSLCAPSVLIYHVQMFDASQDLLYYGLVSTFSSSFLFISFSLFLISFNVLQCYLVYNCHHTNTGSPPNVNVYYFPLYLMSFGAPIATVYRLNDSILTFQFLVRTKYFSSPPFTLWSNGCQGFFLWGRVATGWHWCLLCILILRMCGGVPVLSYTS